MSRRIELERLRRGLLALRRRLAEVDVDGPVSEEQVRALRAALPRCEAKESFGAWVRRGAREVHAGAAVVALRPGRLEAVSIIERLAAATDGDGLALPAPGRALESTDGRFRLRVLEAGERRLRIELIALGLAAETYAGRRLGIAASADGGGGCIELELDADGDGACVVEDSEAVRRVVARPVIGVLG